MTFKKLYRRARLRWIIYIILLHWSYATSSLVVLSVVSARTKLLRANLAHHLWLLYNSEPVLIQLSPLLPRKAACLLHLIGISTMSRPLLLTSLPILSPWPICFPLVLCWLTRVFFLHWFFLRLLSGFGLWLLLWLFVISSVGSRLLDFLLWFLRLQVFGYEQYWRSTNDFSASWLGFHSRFLSYRHLFSLLRFCGCFFFGLFHLGTLQILELWVASNLLNEVHGLLIF